MQTNFNSEELSLIENKNWFELKASASNKTVEFLGRLDWEARSKEEFTDMLINSTSKISKGENFQGFPYFVLDLPKLKQTPFIFSFRVIIWWGNYITVNLLLGEVAFEKLRMKILNNLEVLCSQQFYVNKTDNLWQHDLEDNGNYINGKNLTPKHLNDLNQLKISMKLPIGSINDLNTVLNDMLILKKLID